MAGTKPGSSAGHRLGRLLCVTAILSVMVAIPAGCHRDLLETGGEEKGKTPKMIGVVASEFGLEPLEVMGYGVVAGLAGNGGNIPPGSARSAALRMLAQKKLDDAHGFLASKDAAVVLVRGKVPPGARPGDVFDVDVVCLEEDRQTTSLGGGILLACSLTDTADVSQLSDRTRDRGPNIRTGHDWAVAAGPLVVGLGDGNESRRGRVLSGGQVKKERQLALLIKGKFSEKADTAAHVGRAVDDRFRVQESGSFHRIADAKRKDYVALRVPEVYQHNLQRFLDVLKRIPFEAGSVERLAWQRQCAEELQQPDRCFEAALRLEAMGGETAGILNKARGHQHPKVRFAAAEALAYLGRPDGADTLGQIAERFPEMRAYALAALAIGDDASCLARLRELMTSASVETRCGAFVALRTARPGDLALRSTPFSDAGFILYQAAPQSKPLIHVATAGKPEVVLLGAGHELIPPFSLQAGPELIVTAREGEKQCTIVRTVSGDRTTRESSPLGVADVIQRTVRLGATYADVVEMLRHAAQGKNLSGQFVVDGLPRVAPWFDLARAEIPIQ